LKSGNARYHSVQNPLSTCLLPIIWRVRYTEL
jgi:hypothetical protein